jgi:hypothetical protein
VFLDLRNEWPELRQAVKKKVPRLMRLIYHLHPRQSREVLVIEIRTRRKAMSRGRYDVNLEELRAATTPR